MEKQKKSGTFASFLMRFLSAGARLSLVRFRYGAGLGSAMVRFPIDQAAIRRVLVVLPEDELDAMHHIAAVLSLRQHFGAASLSLLCTGRVADFFRVFPAINEIIEYEPSDRFLFSAPFAVLAKRIHAAGFDLAFLLDPDPGPAICAVVAATRAAYRIGFAGTAEFPFLNCKIRPSDRWTYLTDWNTSIGRVLGAPAARSVRWTVSKESLEEVRHALREQNIGLDKKLLGLDGQYIFRHFGAPWLDALLGRLRNYSGLSTYCVADDDADVLLWLKQRGIAIIPPLSMPKTAALIQLSVLQIAGNTTLYQLAYLLQKPAIGIFSEDQFARYCRPSEVCRGITYKEAPDTGTIAAVLELAARAGIVNEQ